MASSTSNKPVTTPEELLGLVGKQIGNYKILSVLGQGSMGIVYRANDVALLRPTAIKILHWSIRRENHDPVKWFLAEARSIASLNHPGIVQVYNVATFSGHYLIAMELVDGESAEALITNGPLPPAQATEILLQAASALQAAHARGIVHRDVKPPNLLVARDGQVKLTDFGLALTQIGPQTAGRIGTPFFTAPELWTGVGASPASDIYSLGATYFRLLTGRNLFEAASLEEVERLHRNAPAPDVRQFRADLPSACADLIARSVAKVPTERFRSAGELTLAATALLNRLGSQPDLPTVGSSPTGATGFSAEGDPLPPLESPGLEPWAESLGFVRQPFSVVSPAEAPYQGDPFAESRDQLRTLLMRDGAVVVVSGHAQSGRTTTVGQLLHELARSRPVVYFDLEQSSGSLLSRIGTAVGAPPIASPEAAIRALLRKLSSATDRKRPYVIAVDGVRSIRADSELATLAMAASATSSFSLVLIATTGASERLAAEGLPKETNSIAVRPLIGFEVLDYLSEWVQSSCGAGAAPIIITPDAALLIGYWSGGVVGEINRIAVSALILAAGDARRVITSEHVWSAARHIRDPNAPASEDDTPSFGWPTAAGLRGIIAECRIRCGLKPRVELGVRSTQTMREGLTGA